MSEEKSVTEGSEKRNKWKDALNELFSDGSIAERYSEAIGNYKEYLEQRKEEYKQELESIDRLYDTDLLRYIARVLCDIKYKIN